MAYYLHSMERDSCNCRVWLTLSYLIKMYTPQKSYSTDRYLENSDKINQPGNLPIANHLNRYVVDYHKIILTLSVAICSFRPGSYRFCIFYQIRTRINLVKFWNCNRFF